MTINDLPDIDALLRTYANRENTLNERIEIARFFRDVAYQRYISRLDKEIEEMTTELKTNGETLRQQLTEYVLSTGDKHPHESVTVRYVHPLEYDKDEALAWVLEHAPHLVRVRKELDVSKFKEAIKNGHIQWAGAEEVRKVEIVLRPLGHLVEKSEGE